FEDAKLKGKQLLIQYARKGKTIFYSDFGRRIGIHHRNHSLWKLLEQISLEEEREGRGLLSALVVNKGTGRASLGFLAPAKAAGRDISDLDKCWREERDRLFAIWKGETSISETPEESEARAEGDFKLYWH